MIVHTFPKNAREVVYASLEEYQGRSVAALRVHVPTVDGTLVPTHKGLTLSTDSLPELRAAVNALCDAVPPSITPRAA